MGSIICSAEVVQAASVMHLVQVSMSQNNALMVPWQTKHTEEDYDLLGEDWWTCGIRANCGSRTSAVWSRAGSVKRRTFLDL